MNLFHKKISSPFGNFLAVANTKGLVALIWPGSENSWPSVKLEKNQRHEILETTERQLAEYFRGERRDFSVALDLHGTDMQKKIWRRLLSVRFGKLSTYGRIAKSVGSPKGARAIGGAVGRNHIPIIIPCHRIVGSNGKLTGFGPGLPAKIKLLQHEGVSEYT